MTEKRYVKTCLCERNPPYKNYINKVSAKAPGISAVWGYLRGGNFAKESSHDGEFFPRDKSEGHAYIPARAVTPAADALQPAQKMIAEKGCYFSCKDKTSRRIFSDISPQRLLCL